MLRRQPNVIVFSGQGSQSKGGFPLLDSFCSAKGAAWNILRRADNAFRDAFGGASLLAIMRTNPTLVTLTNTDEDGGSTPKKFIHSGGVLNNTVFTQPALLAYQLAALQDIAEKNPDCVPESPPFYVAGHSAGEFTALTAMGVFGVETAIQLVARRGIAMERALDTMGLPDRHTFKTVQSAPPPSFYVLVAVNPARALLGGAQGTPEEVLLALIELVARATALGRSHAMLELVNDNVHGEQLVVAGDRFSASVLGKCLDPQFRSTCNENGIDTLENVVQAALFDCTADDRIGVTKDPNAPPPKPFVHGSMALGRLSPVLQPQPISPDLGMTLTEDRLTRMSSIGAGRSGLKKRSYFMQLPVEVPFHSSALRYAVDEFYAHVQKALQQRSSSSSSSSNDVPLLRNGVWIPNVTGTCAFDPAPESKFRETLLDSFATSVNIGEQAHVGKMVPAAFQKMAVDVQDKSPDCGTAEDKVAALRAATLTAQLCHVVSWSDTMDTILEGCSSSKPCAGDESCSPAASVFEFAPSTPVLSEMFKKAVTASGKKTPLETWTFPRDTEKLMKTIKK